MMYRIEVTNSARKDVLALPRPIYDRVVAVIQQLKEVQWPPGVRKLTGRENSWRIRVGDYRILYEIDKHRQLITVYRIAHRREVYRG